MPYVLHACSYEGCRGVVSATELEVFIEHIPRAERQDACSAATIDVTSLPMRIEQGGYRVSLVPRPLGTRLLSRIQCSCMAISKVWE